MNLLKFIRTLRAIGTSFLITGELLKRLGTAIRSPNLGERERARPGQQELSQDPSNPNGDEGEEPVEVQRELRFEDDS